MVRIFTTLQVVWLLLRLACDLLVVARPCYLPKHWPSTNRIMSTVQWSASIPFDWLLLNGYITISLTIQSLPISTSPTDYNNSSSNVSFIPPILSSFLAIIDKLALHLICLALADWPKPGRNRRTLSRASILDIIWSTPPNQMSIHAIAFHCVGSSRAAQSWRAEEQNCVSETIGLKLDKIPTGSCSCPLKNYSLRLKGRRLNPAKCRSSGCKISLLPLVLISFDFFSVCWVCFVLSPLLWLDLAFFICLFFLFVAVAVVLFLILGQLRQDSKRSRLFRVAHCFHFCQASQSPGCIHLYHLLLL